LTAAHCVMKGVGENAEKTKRLIVSKPGKVLRGMKTEPDYNYKVDLIDVRFKGDLAILRLSSKWTIPLWGTSLCTMGMYMSIAPKISFMEQVSSQTKIKIPT